MRGLWPNVGPRNRLWHHIGLCTGLPCPPPCPPEWGLMMLMMALLLSCSLNAYMLCYMFLPYVLFLFIFLFSSSRCYHNGDVAGSNEGPRDLCPTKTCNLRARTEQRNRPTLYSGLFPIWEPAASSTVFCFQMFANHPPVECC